MFGSNERLSQNFWEHENVWLKHYPAYLIIYCNFKKLNHSSLEYFKIQAKQESGLTPVWHKWDPPVLILL